MIANKVIFSTCSLLLAPIFLLSADNTVVTKHVSESFELRSDLAKKKSKKCKGEKKTHKCIGPTGPRGPIGLKGPTGPRGATGPSGTSSGLAWALTGNANTSSGVAGSSTAGVNFIGTTDAENLEVRLNNATTTFFRFTQAGGLEFINPNSNTFLGLSAGLGNTGGQNVAIGTSALSGSTSGGSNTAVGSSSMLLNETGAQNCAFGQSALLFNRSGGNNVAVGYFSLRSNQNSDSTAVGTNALQSNFEGQQNTAIGSQSLPLNTSGSSNTCVGYQALQNDVSGNQNTAIGAKSLTVNISGSSITCVGYGADVSVDGLTNASAFGNGAIATASNQIIIGNSDVITIGGFANWSNFSDGRYKTHVQENVPGLDFIKKLRPVTYQLDKQKVAEQGYAQTKSTNQGQVIKTGLLAQEVEQAALGIGYDFDGVVKPQNEHDHYRLSYSSFVVPLIKAVQEQQREIEALKREIEFLKTR